MLLTRGADGEVRAFLNPCSHRGAIVVPDGHGTARRFACPYHNWTYDTKGDLVGVTDREFFGDIDTSCLGLTPLPVAERAGLIFVVLTPGAAMDIDEHLCGYDQVLDFFGFGDWHLVSRRELPGPNWKIAYDGYLDFYHLPFLHRNSFGTDISNKAIYHDVGSAPAGDLTRSGARSSCRDLPEDEWDLDPICGGVWTIFPHISFAGGNGGGLISQLFPGTDAGDVGHDPELLRRRRAVRRAPRRGAGHGRLPRAGRPRRGLLHRAAAAAGPRHAAPSESCCSAATRAAASASTRCSTATWTTCRSASAESVVLARCQLDVQARQAAEHEAREVAQLVVVA